MAISWVFTLLLIVSSAFAQSPSAAPAPSPVITVTPSAAPVPSSRPTPSPSPALVAFSPPSAADSPSFAQAPAPSSAAALHRVGYAVAAAVLFAVSLMA